MIAFQNRRILIGGISALLFGLSQLPALAQFDPAQGDRGALVSSDGSVLRGSRLPRSSTVSGSYRGTGRVLAVGEIDDARANIRSRTETADDVWALWNAKPMTRDGRDVRSIIGSDERTRVNPTTTYPARATVLILFEVSEGLSQCTGWLIGKDTVVTAGHCVAKGGSRQFYDAKTYKLYPGRNGKLKPYGACTVKGLYANIHWLANNSNAADYAVIKLNCDIGNTVGWLGFVTTRGSLLNKPVTVQGYPGDKPLTQWTDSDQVRVDQSNRTFYEADTVGGQSGSAVWTNWSSSCPNCAIAVHTLGTGGGGPYATNNSGTRITKSIFDYFVEVKNLP